MQRHLQPKPGDWDQLARVHPNLTVSHDLKQSIRYIASAFMPDAKKFHTYLMTASGRVFRVIGKEERTSELFTLVNVVIIKLVVSMKDIVVGLALDGRVFHLWDGERLAGCNHIVIKPIEFDSAKFKRELGRVVDVNFNLHKLGLVALNHEGVFFIWTKRFCNPLVLSFCFAWAEMKFQAFDGQTSQVVKFVGLSNYVFVLTIDRRLFYGSFPFRAEESKPMEVLDVDGKEILDVASSMDHIVILSCDGQLYSYEPNYNCSLVSINFPPNLKITQLYNTVHDSVLAADSDDHSYLVKRYTNFVTAKRELLKTIRHCMLHISSELEQAFYNFRPSLWPTLDRMESIEKLKCIIDLIYSRSSTEGQFTMFVHFLLRSNSDIDENITLMSDEMNLFVQFEKMIQDTFSIMNGLKCSTPNVADIMQRLYQIKLGQFMSRDQLRFELIPVEAMTYCLENEQTMPYLFYVNDDSTDEDLLHLSPAEGACAFAGLDYEMDSFDGYTESPEALIEAKLDDN